VMGGSEDEAAVDHRRRREAEANPLGQRGEMPRIDKDYARLWFDGRILWTEMREPVEYRRACPQNGRLRDARVAFSAMRACRLAIRMSPARPCG
jgi:hypothetical protein